MAYLPDLSLCTYLAHGRPAEQLRAIGWLDQPYRINPGTIDPEIIPRLQAIRTADPVGYGVAAVGRHLCTYCFPEGADLSQATSEHLSSRHITVPGNGFLYVAPEAIIHYIEAHGYTPPEEFCAAVLSCPDPTTQMYLDLVRQNGPGYVAVAGGE